MGKIIDIIKGLLTDVGKSIWSVLVDIRAACQQWKSDAPKREKARIKREKTALEYEKLKLKRAQIEYKREKLESKKKTKEPDSLFDSHPLFQTRTPERGKREEHNFSPSDLIGGGG